MYPFTQLITSSDDLLPTGCRICHLNVRSIKNKIDELSVLLHCFNIDVMTISETWLTESIEDTCLSIQGYNLCRADRVHLQGTKKGGGLMVFAKKGYKLDSTKFSSLNICNSSVEVQVVEITKPNHKTNILVNTYRPPSGSQSDFLTHIQAIMSEISTLRYQDVFLFGDLNLDHSRNMKNETTKTLENSLKGFGLTQLISKPTRKASSTSTLIDVLYGKTSRKIHPFIIQSSLSDHFLVGSVLFLDYCKPETTTFKGRSFRKYNKEEARTYYSRRDSTIIYQMNDVDLVWSFLEKLILQCANTQCPIRTITTRKER